MSRGDTWPGQNRRRNAMKPFMPLKLLRFLASVCLVCIALTPPVRAQAAAAAAPNEAVRARISEALARGDFAAAEKFMNSLQPTKAGAAALGGSTVFEEIKACGFYPQES